MGQTSSANIGHLPSNSSLPEPIKTKQPPRRPTSPPVPKTPNYVVAQNKVLPGNIPLDGRANLRPVSQELVKFMPEIADVYKADSDEGLPMDYDIDKENLSEVSLKEPLDGPMVSPGPKLNSPAINGVPNGKILENGEIHNDSGIFEGEPTLNTVDTPRTNGLSHLRHASFDKSGRVKGHRRHPSTSTSLLNEHNTIPEDPREHLYNEWKKDPYNNPVATGSSLPLKSNFDMDESFNLTYAQLAESRRKKTLEDLEKRTGKKIQDLSNDLANQTNVIPSPFDKYSLSPSSPRITSISITRSNSISTASSDTGVSKRKKKRAPPPPNQNGIIEPPVDYDLDLSTRSLPRPVRTDASSISGRSTTSTIPRAPPPPVHAKKKAAPVPPGKLTPRSEPSSTASSTNVSRSNSFKTPPVMPKPPKELTELEKRLQAVRSMVEEKIDRGNQEELTEKEKEEQKDEVASMSTDTTVSSMSDNISLYSNESKTKTDAPVLQTEESVEDKPLATSVEETVEPEPELRKVETKEEKFGPNKSYNKLSTLLQHDIITAAQARGSKIVKRQTPVPEKPKDQTSVFKEQLGKALSERDDRMKRSISIDEMLNKNRQSVPTGNVLEVAPKPKHVIPNRHSVADLSSIDSHVESIQKSKSTGNIINGNKDKTPSDSVFPEEWTPEHDLDTDEEMDDQQIHSHRRSTSEGFKSQIIPVKVKDLKSNKSTAKGKIYKQSDPSQDDKNKYGSIRKIKKSVHQGVKNAFGSISRASGKILRRQRDPNAGQKEPKSANWRFSSSSLNRTPSSQDVNNNSDSEESDLETRDIEDVRFDLPDAAPVKDSEDVKPMKRAGVAYVSGHGQLVVLPDFHSVKSGNQDDDEGRAPKIYRKKKKKLSYESTVRKQERQMFEEQIAEQIKAKELEIERERTRQMEMELEYRRLRDLESQEKLQRIQTEKMQQELNLMNQQPTLTQSQPPAMQNFPKQTYNPLLANNIPLTNPVMTMNFTQPNTVLNPVHPNFTSPDIIQISEYMRAMGVPPPSTPQQWAYLLSSVNFSSPSPASQHNMYIPNSAPDLSTVFSRKDQQRVQKESMMTYRQPEANPSGQMSNEKKKMIELLSNGKNSEFEMDNASLRNLLSDFQNGNIKGKSKEKMGKTEQRNNPVYYSSDEDDDDDDLDGSVDGGKPHHSIPSMIQPVSGQIVYDTIGYKTVIYNPSSAPQSPASIDGSSSGADR